MNTKEIPQEAEAFYTLDSLFISQKRMLDKEHERKIRLKDGHINITKRPLEEAPYVVQGFDIRVMPRSEDQDPISFQITEKGLLKLFTFNHVETRIGDKVFYYKELAEIQQNGRGIRQLWTKESQQAFRRSGKDLALWVQQMVSEGRYSPPPISKTIK